MIRYDSVDLSTLSLLDNHYCVFRESCISVLKYDKDLDLLFSYKVCDPDGVSYIEYDDDDKTHWGWYDPEFENTITDMHEYLGEYAFTEKEIRIWML